MSKTRSHKKVKIRHNKFNTEWTDLYETNIFDSTRKLDDLFVDLFMEYGSELLEEHIVRNVVGEIRTKYNKNSYHNFEHASHVTLNCANALHNVREMLLSPVEQISLIFAALIHDVEHLGMSNNTLIKKEHELAILYNDQSVAEMNSLSVGLNLISRSPEYNLTKNFSAEDKTLFRRNVIELVLCTDIAEPIKKKMTYVKVEELSSSSGDGRLDVSSPAGRVSLMALILRTCDIGSSTQSFRTMEIWAHRFFCELKTAALAGNGPPAGVDFFFTDQVAYMNSHVDPLIRRLGATGAMKAEFVQTLNENLYRNVAQWREAGMPLLIEWDSGSSKGLRSHK